MSDTTIGMTYAEAIAAGWTYDRTAWARGYVSRRLATGTAPVYRTKRGRYYVTLPSWDSTQYCLRQYLFPPTTSVWTLVK